MAWRILLDDGAKKYLRRVPKSDSERILRAIKGLVADPYGGDIEKMQGEENVWRRRIGSYRFLYEIYQSTRMVYVFDIERRSSSTYSR
ncbi:MAG: type II toxin-antitoxin system RelE/ParE family toxin [bacterium]|nr:type II toxin-antitoxin system RelE/ParE family toxin [bacterium]